MSDALRESSIETKDIRIDLVVPNPENVNEMDSESFAALVDNIKEVGFISPVQVVPYGDGQYMLMNGEHRWKAAQVAGFSYITANILTDAKWTDKDFFDLVSFRMNGIHGKTGIKFQNLYDKMVSKFGADGIQKVLAVTDKQVWKSLTKNIKQGLKEQGVPSDVIDKVEEASKKMKSVEDFSKKIGKIFNDYSDSSFGSTLICMNGKNSVMIQANDAVFASMKFLHEYANDKKLNINDILEPTLRQVLIGLGS